MLKSSAPPRRLSGHGRAGALLCSLLMTLALTGAAHAQDRRTTSVVVELRGWRGYPTPGLDADGRPFQVRMEGDDNSYSEYRQYTGEGRTEVFEFRRVPVPGNDVLKYRLSLTWQVRYKKRLPTDEFRVYRHEFTQERDIQIHESDGGRVVHIVIELTGADIPLDYTPQP